MEDISKLSSAQISNLIDSKEKELGIATNAFYEIEQEKLFLQRQILELRIKQKDIEVVLSKASQNLKKMQLELKALRSFFWQSDENITNFDPKAMVSHFASCKDAKLWRKKNE